MSLDHPQAPEWREIAKFSAMQEASVHCDRRNEEERVAAASSGIAHFNIWAPIDSDYTKFTWGNGEASRRDWMVFAENQHKSMVLAAPMTDTNPSFPDYNHCRPFSLKDVMREGPETSPSTRLADEAAALDLAGIFKEAGTEELKRLLADYEMQIKNWMQEVKDERSAARQAAMKANGAEHLARVAEEDVGRVAMQLHTQRERTMQERTLRFEAEQKATAIRGRLTRTTRWAIAATLLLGTGTFIAGRLTSSHDTDSAKAITRAKETAPYIPSLSDSQVYNWQRRKTEGAGDKPVTHHVEKEKSSIILEGVTLAELKAAGITIRYGRLITYAHNGNDIFSGSTHDEQDAARVTKEPGGIRLSLTNEYPSVQEKFSILIRPDGTSVADTTCTYKRPHDEDLIRAYSKAKDLEPVLAEKTNLEFRGGATMKTLEKYGVTAGISRFSRSKVLCFDAQAAIVQDSIFLSINHDSKTIIDRKGNTLVIHCTTSTQAFTTSPYYGPAVFFVELDHSVRKETHEEYDPKTKKSAAPSNSIHQDMLLGPRGSASNSTYILQIGGDQSAVAPSLPDVRDK